MTDTVKGVVFRRDDGFWTFRILVNFDEKYELPLPIRYPSQDAAQKSLELALIAALRMLR